MPKIFNRWRSAQRQIEQYTSPGPKEPLFSMYLVRGRGLPILRVDSGLVAVPADLRAAETYQQPASRPPMVVQPDSHIVHDYEVHWPLVQPPRTRFARMGTIPVYGFLLGPNSTRQAADRVAETISRARDSEAIRPIVVIGVTATRNLIEAFREGKPEWGDAAYDMAEYVFEAALAYQQRQ